MTSDSKKRRSSRGGSEQRRLRNPRAAEAPGTRDRRVELGLGLELRLDHDLVEEGDLERDGASQENHAGDDSLNPGSDHGDHDNESE